MSEPDKCAQEREAERRRCGPSPLAAAYRAWCLENIIEGLTRSMMIRSEPPLKDEPK